MELLHKLVGDHPTPISCPNATTSTTATAPHPPTTNGRSSADWKKRTEPMNPLLSKMNGPTSQHSTMNPHPDCHLTTIGEIERVTGIDSLPGVAGTKRTAMENFKAPALWPKE
jgi:hypothetical protein